MPASAPAPENVESISRGQRGSPSIIEDGVLAGILGALAVAVFFLLLDTVRGQPMITPTLLGSALFLGERVDGVTSVAVPMVFAYTGIHVLLFLIAGTAVAWMVSQFERNPQFGMVLALIFVLFEAVLFGLEVTIVPNLVGALGAWAVAVANVLSAVVMFWYLLRRHPDAIPQLRQSWNE